MARESKKHPTFGYHRLTLLINKKYQISLNRKTVYRYRKYLGIQAIRRKKKYKLPIGLKQGKVATNIVDRNFKPDHKNNIWSIDITYIPHKEGTQSYLFAIKDLYDKSIIDYEHSSNMEVGFVIDPLKRAIKNNNIKNLIIHSDQGIHFTCTEYLDLLKDNRITISHSRRGNCLDNAPIESFFSLYKHESLWIENPVNYMEAKKQIKEYMYYYNHNRIQIGLNGKTPSEYRLST